MPKKVLEEEKTTKEKGKRQDNEVPRRSPRLKAKNDNEERKSKRGKSKNASPTNEEEKKVKDPAAPKKAKSSYLWFCNANRKNVMDDNPGKKIGEINKILGTMWSNLPGKEEKKYKKMAKEDEAR
jgi:hypothetical protein